MTRYVFCKSKSHKHFTPKPAYYRHINKSQLPYGWSKTGTTGNGERFESSAGLDAYIEQGEHGYIATLGKSTSSRISGPDFNELYYDNFKTKAEAEAALLQEMKKYVSDNKAAEKRDKEEAKYYREQAMQDDYERGIIDHVSRQLGDEGEEGDVETRWSPRDKDAEDYVPPVFESVEDEQKREREKKKAVVTELMQLDNDIKKLNIKLNELNDKYAENLKEKNARPLTTDEKENLKNLKISLQSKLERYNLVYDSLPLNEKRNIRLKIYDVVPVLVTETESTTQLGRNQVVSLVAISRKNYETRCGRKPSMETSAEIYRLAMKGKIVSEIGDIEEYKTQLGSTQAERLRGISRENYEKKHGHMPSFEFNAELLKKAKQGIVLNENGDEVSWTTLPPRAGVAAHYTKQEAIDELTLHYLGQDRFRNKDRLRFKLMRDWRLSEKDTNEILTELEKEGVFK